MSELNKADEGGIVNKPTWDDAGLPTNIEAAAIDLMEWVEWLRKKVRRHDMSPENTRRVRASIQSVYQFLPKQDAP